MFVAMDERAQLITLVTHEQAAKLRQHQFVCPACRRLVRIKNGAVLPAHFAHVGPACQAASEGESDDHLRGKRWLAELGMKLGYQVALETYYPQIKQRADVIWQRLETTMVLEFQCSPLSPQRLAARTRGYHKLGLTVVWVLGPRYYSKRPGMMQARFLQYSPRYGYHLWFSDGRRFLEVWQLVEQGYLVRRFGADPLRTKRIGVGRSKYSAARMIQNQLHYREPKALALQALAYQQGHHLAGLPWIVHERPLTLLGLKVPEWQVRTKFLLTFGDRDISREMFVEFWQGQAAPELTPLIDQGILIDLAARRWLSVLQDAHLLIAIADGWRWCAMPVWYPDLTRKLQALQ